MRKITIPGTDLNSSAICLGGGSFCIENNKAFSFDLMNTYFELGGNIIDTANIYGKWLSSAANISEIVMGQWMQEKNNRHELIIATKGGHPDLGTMHISRLSKKEVTQDLEESLKALKTDYIDIYWLHRDDEKLPVSTIMEYLNRFVKEGKIRYFGCSNWKVSRIKEAMHFAAENNFKSFIGNQMMWSLAVPNEDAIQDKTMVLMDTEGYYYHKETMLTAIPYSSQANGFFEKLREHPQKPLGQGINDRYYNKQNIESFVKVQNVAELLSKSISEIVLGYMLSQPFTTIPIIGCSSVGQLKESLKAGDLVLPKDIMDLFTFPGKLSKQ